MFQSMWLLSIGHWVAVGSGSKPPQMNEAEVFATEIETLSAWLWRLICFCYVARYCAPHCYLLRRMQLLSRMAPEKLLRQELTMEVAAVLRHEGYQLATVGPMATVAEVAETMVQVRTSAAAVVDGAG